MSLAKRAIRGVTWTVAATVGSRALGVLGTLLLTRYLAPSEYGEVSLASVVVLSVNQLSSLGVGMYLVTNPRAERAVIYHATVLSLSLPLLLLSGVALMRREISALLEAEGMSRFVPGLVVAVLLERVGYVPERLVIRDLRFGLVSITRTAAECAYTAVSVVLAMLGWGGMSVVLGNLARAAVRTSILVASCDARIWLEPARLRLRTMLTLLGYGTAISLAALADTLSRKWDNLLVSRFFGPSVVGVYNLAYNLAEIPAMTIGEQIADVLLVSLARMDEEKRLRTLLRSIALLALIMCPLSIGFGCIATTLSSILFPSRWSMVGEMLMILSVLSMWRPLECAIIAYLQARNCPGLIMKIDWVAVALLLGLISTLGRASPRWLCVAVGLAFAMRTLIYMIALRALDNVPIGQILGRILPPLLCCLPMATLVLAIGAGGKGMHPEHVLPLQVMAGAAMYALTAFTLMPRTTRDLLRLLRTR